mmetsp:Transcript_10297/g.15385  ORF Transcript_10297/g.15385 Transcript_10297/m.15385 type:complete len:94 (-) Transcript_10297:111-392(-)
MGFCDSWRYLNSKEDDIGYTFWGYRMNSRGKNNGWRLDYFILSERLVPALRDVIRRNELWGPSDHIPLVMTLDPEELSKITSLEEPAKAESKD